MGRDDPSESWYSLKRREWIEIRQVSGQVANSPHHHHHKTLTKVLWEGIGSLYQDRSWEYSNMEDWPGPNVSMWGSKKEGSGKSVIPLC